MTDTNKKIPADVYAFMRELVQESLRDWFKKEKWVRISSSGNIAGPCGTSKNKKNPDRCLPKAKAQSLTKGQRAATAQKKKKAGSKGKTVVKNTKKATVKKEERVYSDSKIEDRLVQLAQSIGREKFAMHILYDLPGNLKRAVLDALDASKGGIYDLEPVAENAASNHDGKAAPFGSGYKKADKFAGSDPKAGSTIKGTGFDWKRVTKEDIRNLVVGLMNEDQEEVLMEKDDRCTRIAKRKYDTWPSAYASGAVVRCRRGEIWKKEK